jgi:hypothetical protein
MSDFLFARPSFLSGMARVADLFGQFDSYNDSVTPVEADRKAALADWTAVGNDMRHAMSRFEAERAAEAK